MDILNEDKTDLKVFLIGNNHVLSSSKKYPFLSVLERNLSNVILEALNAKPDHIAQIMAESKAVTTLGEMKDRSVRCALWLMKQGIGPGDIVACCADNHLDSIIPILATFYVGAVTSPWSVTDLETTEYLMELFEPKIIFSSVDAIKVLKKSAELKNVDTKIIVFGKYDGLESFSDILNDQVTNADVQTFIPRRIEDPPNALALVLLSSGTVAGLPNAVMHSYENVLKQIVSFSRYPLKGNALWYSGHYSTPGFYLPFQSIFSYGLRIIDKEFDVKNICNIIVKFKVESVFLLPAMMNYMLKFDALKDCTLTTLKLVIVAGTQINQGNFKEFKDLLPDTLVLKHYYIAEIGSCPILQTSRCTKASTGTLQACTEAKILDLDLSCPGQSMKPLQVGELCLKSDLVMMGYYKNKQLTTKVIDPSGWLHTQDKAMFDRKGEFYVIERVSDKIQFEDIIVSPADIEQAIGEQPTVLEIAVVPKSEDGDSQRYEHVAVLVTMLPELKVDFIALELIGTKILRKKKANLWLRVFVLDELPKTPCGKILKRNLIKMVQNFTF